MSAATRPAGPPGCRCTPGPVPVAVYRNGDLIEIRRRHWQQGDPAVRHGKRATCGRDLERVTPADWRQR